MGVTSSKHALDLAQREICIWTSFEFIKKKILNRVSKYTITNTHTHKKEDGDHKFCHIKASSLPYNAHIFLHKNIKRSCLLSAYRTKSRLLENWYAYWFSFQTAVLQKLIQTERWKRTEVWPAWNRHTCILRVTQEFGSFFFFRGTDWNSLNSRIFRVALLWHSKSYVIFNKLVVKEDMVKIYRMGGETKRRT